MKFPVFEFIKKFIFYLFKEATNAGGKASCFGRKNYREKLKANNPEKYEEIKKKATENALRHKKQIDETNENLKNVLIRLKQLENSKTLTESEEASMMRQNRAKYTPRKKVEEFISENIPHIETPKKEVIKQNYWSMMF
ncbi:unnamed protein product [Parnassius apollo]|uniref:(apollo) hypothetical protein n=1 Tax=Parnassius apollo TaxID=110799 RepID=A0A8S3WTB8_PARAO|nr:unnamed protein product [Parnassius apollo]